MRGDRRDWPAEVILYIFQGKSGSIGSARNWKEDTENGLMWGVPLVVQRNGLIPKTFAGSSSLLSQPPVKDSRSDVVLSRRPSSEKQFRRLEKVGDKIDDEKMAAERKSTGHLIEKVNSFCETS